MTKKKASTKKSSTKTREDKERPNNNDDVQQDDAPAKRGRKKKLARYQVFSPKPDIIMVNGSTINIHTGHNVIELDIDDDELESMLQNSNMKLVAKLFS